MKIEGWSRSAEETGLVGEILGGLLAPGDVVLLHGDLGAGKTTLTQGIARGLAVTDFVQSPTFTLVAEHEGRFSNGQAVRLYHLDLYRLTSVEELDDLGWDDLLSSADVVVVEWPERAAHHLPERFLLVRLELDPGGRRLTIWAIEPTNDDHQRLTRLVEKLQHQGLEFRGNDEGCAH